MNSRRVLLLGSLGLISVLLAPAVAADMHNTYERGYQNLDESGAQYQSGQAMNQRQFDTGRYYDESYDSRDYRSQRRDGYYRENTTDSYQRTPQTGSGEYNEPAQTQQRKQDNRRQTRPVPDDYSSKGYFAQSNQEPQEQMNQTNQTEQGSQEQMNRTGQQEMIQNETMNQTGQQDQMQQRQGGQQGQSYEGYMIMRSVSGNETGRWQVFRFQVEQIQDAFGIVFGGNR